MRELMQEREARTSLEKQLEGAVAENKSCNAQLEALQEEIIRLRSASSVDSLCDNAESCKRLQVRRLDKKICHSPTLPPSPSFTYLLMLGYIWCPEICSCTFCSNQKRYWVEAKASNWI